MLYHCVFIIIIIIGSVGKHQAVYYGSILEDITTDMTKIELLD